MEVSGNAPIEEDEGTRTVHRDHYMQLLRGDYIVTSAVVIYRRSALDKVGGYDSSLHTNENYDLNLRLTRQAPVFFHGEVVAQPAGRPVGNFRTVADDAASAFKVLRRQSLPADDARQKVAAEVGMDMLSRRLGLAAVSDVRENGKIRSAATIAHLLRTMVRHHPRGIASFVASEIRPWIDRRRPGVHARCFGPDQDQRFNASADQIIESIIRTTVPHRAHILIVNPSRQPTLAVPGYTISSFPASDVVSVGPAPALGVVDELEAERARGAEYLLIPGEARWWMEHQCSELARYVEGRYRRLWADAACAVYAMTEADIAVRKILITGHFSFAFGNATAGDLLARDMLREWLEDAGYIVDTALAAPFRGGVDWRTVDQSVYSHLIFVCGPFPRLPGLVEMMERFAECRRVGLNVSMTERLESWNPFDVLIERDSSALARPDMVFAAPRKPVPVIGVCFREHAAGTRTANALIARLIESTEMAVVDIDTRMDSSNGESNSAGLRSPAEVEALIARVDVIVTTRLHGLVMGIKNGIPVLAIDPGNEGMKILRQAEVVDWPMAFDIRDMDDDKLYNAFVWCRSREAKLRAQRSAGLARPLVEEIRKALLASLT